MNRAESRLPQPVRQMGVQITDNGSGFMMLIGIASKRCVNDAAGSWKLHQQQYRQ
ncbi:MAG TPA: hypothetical protein VF503_16055 [Sphingobium sp.]